ncbi:hypothetical protein D082_29170 [Synechocystis sp. PCC 6714]|nr:hypothetical protein D082_29170 [Synechocystis sp. PCC 6714]
MAMVSPSNSPQPQVNEAENANDIKPELVEPVDPTPLTSPFGSTPKTLQVWWQSTRQHLEKFFPLGNLSKKILDRLWVDEAHIADILTQLRQELPTTEALLIGKPQSGKSSLVRGLTGASAEIVGQGFQPHTQNTARYAYPSEDLPLLIFTDTVGLGDIGHDTQSLIAELKADLATPEDRVPAAKILLLTVKITDFATDSLQQIIKNLKTAHPEIPCLLVVTCLHEVYCHPGDDHPPYYPPEQPEIERAFAAIAKDFAQWIDGAVMVDFTQEEDGYNPEFYGLAHLRDQIAERLPKAEAQTLHQLLDGETGDRLGNIYRDVARRYILAFSVMAATLAAVPLPFATMPVLTALQVSLVGILGKLYGQDLTPSQAGGVVSAIAGGFLAQAVGRELLKFVPGFGSVVAASWAGAYTWSLGEGACVYFGDLLGGKKPDPKKIQAVMRHAFDEAQNRFTQAPNGDNLG